MTTISKTSRVNYGQKTYVVFPLNSIKGDGVDILIEDERKRDGKVEEREAFGTKRERQNLDGVGNDEGGECDTVIN